LSRYLETLWRKIKYEWLKPQHYQSWQTLCQAVTDICLKVGHILKIDFDEPNYFKNLKRRLFCKDYLYLFYYTNLNLITTCRPEKGGQV